MQVIESGTNSLKVVLPPGEQLNVFPQFAASGGFSPKPLVLGVLVSRWLTGRVTEYCYDADQQSAVVQLHGTNAHGSFHVVPVQEGQAMVIQLRDLAGYRLGSSKARLASYSRIFSPVRWYTRTAFAVVMHGPAELIFYGSGLQYSECREHQECFAGRLVAFDARAPFRIRGLRPTGSVGSVLDALSTVVDVSFLSPTPLVWRTTVQDGKAGSRVPRVLQLVFGGLICGSIVEHLLFSRWLWSWIS